MDIINQVNNCYAAALKERFSTAEYKQFKMLLSEYNFLDKEKIFAQSLKPYFLPVRKREEFSKITYHMLAISEKFSRAYYTNEKLRSALSINGRVGNYLSINPGYSQVQLVVRLDAYYDAVNDDLKFLEINCDDPSGMGINEFLIKMFDQLLTLRFIKDEYKTSRDNLIDSLYKMLIKRYQEYCTTFKKKFQKDPHIVIACSRNSSIRRDVNSICEILKEKGIHVSYADPRDLEYDDNLLKLNGEEVNIIYRDNIHDFFRTESQGKIHSGLRNKVLEFSMKACLHSMFLNRYLKKGYFGHAEDAVQAYCENNVCMINPFSSGICAQKSVFALIQDESFRCLLDEEEKNVADKYIPWTRFLRDNETLYEKEKVNLIPFIKENRNNFVLKPNNGFGGKGIIIGAETDQTDWEIKVDWIIQSGLKYIVQQYINVPTEEFPVFSNGEFKGFKAQYININFWGIDGTYAGAYTRTSENKIINVALGGRYVPVYYILN